MTPSVEMASMWPPAMVADGFVLMSFWKPILLLLPFVGFAWLVSNVFDKHCARFFLPREQWNIAHLSVALVAFAAAVLMPISGEGAFWAGFGAVLVLLSADVAVFLKMVNQDDRVPEGSRLNLFDMTKLRAAQADKAAKAKQGKVTLVIRGADKQAIAPPSVEAPEFAVRVAAEAMLTAALEARASQVDVGPSGNNQYSSAPLIDGVRGTVQALAPNDAVAMIDFWKGCAKLDVADRRRKQQADITVEREGEKPKKIRVLTLGAQGGPRLTLTVDPEQQVRRKPEELGLLEVQFKAVEQLVSENKGLVLLASPPDGGRTTTLYSLLKMHDPYTSNVQTVETEMQDALEGIRQNRFDAAAEGPEYSTLVRSIIRRDPNVLGVAELPDQATAKEIVKADFDRVRVYVCLRAGGGIEAIQGWLKAVGDAESAVKNLRGVVSQRLLRKVCTNCRVPYQPSPDMLKKLGLPADKVKQLVKKGGQVLVKNKPEVCPVCQGIGYVGQEAIFEVYVIDAEERELIKAADWNGLRAALRKKGAASIQQAAIRKAADGSTTIEEVMRVTTDAAPSGPAAAPAAKA